VRSTHVKWIAFQCVMARLQAVHAEGGFKIQRIAANVRNKHSRGKSTRGGPIACGLGRRENSVSMLGV
jgi:hypothetical protein